MSPYPGSIHRRARSDSGAARLWQWARSRRAPWTPAQAAEAAEISERRARAIIAALYDAGLLDCAAERERGLAGWEPSLWRVSAAGRKITGAPIMVVSDGIIQTARPPGDGAGNDRLRAALTRAGLSPQAAAEKLRVNRRTLHLMLSGALPISADDQIIAGARGARKS